MERIKVLVNNLQEQLAQNADVSKMLLTVQMIQAELMFSVQKKPESSKHSKVSIILPQSFSHKTANETVQTENIPEEKKYIISEIEPFEDVRKEEKMILIEKDMASFDPMIEVPTLSHNQDIKGILEKNIEKESLNDKLRQSKIELGEILKESPVKDLKKAIGINDRFTFIDELFRGDESMYERSIKTINGFNIYPEAEYWINRELIVKMGWDGTNETVKHFNQLVKRRFS